MSGRWPSVRGSSVQYRSSVEYAHRPMPYALSALCGLLALCCALALVGCAAPPATRGDSLALERYALMQTLNAELLASRSATATLREWCARHRLAAVAEITAERLAVAPLDALADQRMRLMVAAEEPIEYRQVQLRCGGQLLSVAENWYVPARLPPEMNRLLASTQTPFGQVIAVLEPYRRTFDLQVHWPMPGAATPRSGMPPVLFEHRAVVYSAEHLPLAEVRERYQRSALPEQ